MDVINNYDIQVRPFQNDHGKWQWTRADKATRYAHYEADKRGETSLGGKERRSIELLKIALKRAKKPVVACSFGIDSIVTLYLVRKALTELGRDPSDVDIVWNDTKNEFPAVRLYAKQMTELWNLRLIVTAPKKALKKIIEDNGGITSDYFTARKGDRRHGQPLSEKCCNTLKHEPMNRIKKEHDFDLNINGTRADESRQRFLSSLRDGEYFYSSGTWKSMLCKPIMWWNEADIWAYVERESIPYNDLYKQNLIQKYPASIPDELAPHFTTEEFASLRGRQTQTVTRAQAIILEKHGFKLFTPRTGCMMCPIPVKYGYLQWMRTYYPKVYEAMIHNLGYGPALLDMVPQNVRDEIREFTGVDITAEDAAEHLRDILEAKPCVFDVFDTKKKKEAN